MNAAISLPHKGPVIGVGVDMVSIDRVRRLIERQGDRFLKRVFTADERVYCGKFKDPSGRYAARFAAKEAVAKAFTTGIGARLGWQSVSIVSGPRGQPMVKLDALGDQLLYQVGGNAVMVSLSHTADNAIAFAVIVA